MNSRYTGEELAVWTGGEWSPSVPNQVRGISHDTRTLQAGDVYLAVKGETHDGHDFLAEAFKQGAVGAVVASQSGLEGCEESPLLVVEDTSAALQDMASAYRLKVNPHIVAVTGSAGKSTVKEMTASMLSTAGPTARTRGNWNNDIGLPLSLLAMEADTRYGVFEVGMNHEGEIAQLCRILKPSWGIVTNIGPVHMEFFKSIEGIAEEKSSLLRSLPPDGLAVLNSDEGFFDLLCSACAAPVVTTSLHGNADYTCGEILRTSGQIVVSGSDTDAATTLMLPSMHEYNILNALLAIATARSLNIGWAEIQEALNTYESLPMRWQEEDIGAIHVVNDAYNANPLSMRSSLRAFTETKVDGGRWLLLADMRELGNIQDEQHFKLGEYVAEGDWKGLVTVGDLGSLIAEGARSAGMPANRVYVCTSNEHAAQLALGQMVAGDAVLLKGSRGMKLEGIVEFMKRNTEGG
ncbi:MAG: UDP-N-acetylmuramoyl-tripeptide--D-alanyl-D-alanine ligase [Kiritimatiellia bacterium]|jgi:UDP-N-acetylmuramoyl-tripeptide--D-alanyl-D-alanine ligase|nr:UDP-N-acetylmuramoyl-tripeptide--D-alanyl-D-alanine ligase [Kiritimatiellia bacterium]